MRRFLACLLPIAFVALPLRADLPSPAPPQGTLYLGNGRTLEAATPRQLSLNAHVAEFACQPGGLEAAYVGTAQSDETQSAFVKLVGLRHGETYALLSEPISADIDLGARPLTLQGWSADGRFLLVQWQQFIAQVDLSPEGSAKIRQQFLCVDAGADPIRSTPIDLPEVAPAAEPSIQSTLIWWSPNRQRVLFTTRNLVPENNYNNLVDVFCNLYEPLRKKLTPVSLDGKSVVRGWLDDTHLLLRNKSDGKTHYFQYDLAAGKQTEVPMPHQMPTEPGEGTSSETSPVSSSLHLDDELHTVWDKAHTTSGPFHALWVHRARFAMPVGLTPGKDTPQARWSPTGRQIVFVAHGDLFVTDLSERDATPRERIVAGETLPCPVERALAADSLRQIGLSLLQYTQDYDEILPPASNVSDGLGPYLKDSGELSLGPNHFIYQPPSNLGLASQEKPAETVIGHYDTRCALVTLYMDGHVTVTDRAGPQP